jgi:xanthine dehydrogenase small subunit
MLKFILNDQTIETDLPPGMTVLDFVRYRKDLKGTKIGCREGDCGACTILVGEVDSDSVVYRSMTSCLMPLANAYGKHIVTIEGINPPEGELTKVQQAMVDENGTQCGFCTVGFVMSLTGFCIDDSEKTCAAAVSSVDGNICRCTGYKSIERAAAVVSGQLSGGSNQQDAGDNLNFAIKNNIVPEYFSGIREKLSELKNETDRPPAAGHRPLFVAGGTDLYVQRPEEMAQTAGHYVFDNSELRKITESEKQIEIGASAVVTDLLVSPVFQKLFPNLYKHLKLVSSTPIRNMATLAGNFVNASPIGDMTAWFLALNAEIELSAQGGNATVMERADLSEPGTPLLSEEGWPKAGVVEAATGSNTSRWIALKDLYLGYKKLAKTEDEFITKIRFRKGFTHFNFEKVSKRTYLDISSVNTAISLRVSSAMSEPPASAGGPNTILDAHVSAGGVAPVPMYLTKTSEFLRGKEINETTVAEANEIMQTEISPISDVRGSEKYKRLLLRQLFTAHFVELFKM